MRMKPTTYARRFMPVQVCILAVPKFVAFRAGADEAAHLRAVGYRVTSDEGEPVQLEGTDDFVTRMQAWAWIALADCCADFRVSSPIGTVHMRRKYGLTTRSFTP